MSNIILLSSQIDWNATWLYLNNNTKRTNNYTNFSLNQSKSFKIKTLLNILPTLHHLYELYPDSFQHNNCITCQAPEHQLHWLLCPNPTNLTSIITETISETINNNSLPDITQSQLQQLNHLLTQHNSLSVNNAHRGQSNIYTTLQGYVPTDLITTIRPYTTSHQTATSITTKLLTKISQKIYDRIWKPYATKLAQWKKDNNITPNNRSTTHRRFYNYSNQHHNLYYTVCQLCGLSNQLHTEDNNCPPLGNALRKIDLWSVHWILYSYPTNNILYYQI
jgi:hypothetical protein